MMLAVGSAVGAVMAFCLLCDDCHQACRCWWSARSTFLTAIIASFKTVRSNFAVMLGWAAIIAVLLFAAMLPGFVGLMVALPVLGHATWHLYRRAVV